MEDSKLEARFKDLKSHLSGQHDALEGKVSSNAQSINEIKLMQAQTQQYLEDHLGSGGSIRRLLSNIEDDVRDHRKTLYGKDGNNGVVGKVNEHSRKWSFAGKMVVAVWTAMISGFVGIFSLSLK